MENLIGLKQFKSPRKNDQAIILLELIKQTKTIEDLRRNAKIIMSMLTKYLNNKQNIHKFDENTSIKNLLKQQTQGILRVLQSPKKQANKKRISKKKQVILIKQQKQNEVNHNNLKRNKSIPIKFKSYSHQEKIIKQQKNKTNLEINTQQQKKKLEEDLAVINKLICQQRMKMLQKSFQNLDNYSIHSNSSKLVTNSKKYFSSSDIFLKENIKDKYAKNDTYQSCFIDKPVDKFHQFSFQKQSQNIIQPIKINEEFKISNSIKKISRNGQIPKKVQFKVKDFELEQILHDKKLNSLASCFKKKNNL